MTAPVQQAILALPETAWTAAVEADGEPRDGADVAELTGVLPARLLASYRQGRGSWSAGNGRTRAPSSPFTDVDGWRFQPIATDTRRGQLAFLEARHRAHARVEDSIRTGKDTGLRRFPSRQYGINAVWLELSLAAADLLAWTKTMLLDGDLAKAEPTRLRYRLLHVAARITRPSGGCSCASTRTGRGGTPSPPPFARLQALPLPIT